MDSTRQQKIARQIQKDIGDIFLKEGADLVRGVLVTVTKVRVSPDVGLARIYVSVFPFDRGGQVLEHLVANVSRVRGMLGHRVRSQFRVVPELAFHLDDSMEYVEHIDSLLK